MQVADNDPEIQKIMFSAISYLGVGLANIVNFISPKLILVEGYIMNNENNRRILQETMSENLFGLNTEEVKMEFIPFNKFSGSRGAGVLALKKYLIENKTIN